MSVFYTNRRNQSWMDPGQNNWKKRGAGDFKNDENETEYWGGDYTLYTFITALITTISLIWLPRSRCFLVVQYLNDKPNVKNKLMTFS